MSTTSKKAREQTALLDVPATEKPDSTCVRRGLSRVARAPRATFQLRAKDGVQVILHLGAKKRDDLVSGIAIPDPESLLEWLATDRASVRFRDMKDIDAKSSTFANLIRQWIKQVQAPGP